MKRLKTENIQGNEILAKDISMSSGTVILTKGTRLKAEYKERLIELNVSEIFVADEENIKTQIETEYKDEKNNRLQDAGMLNHDSSDVKKSAENVIRQEIHLDEATEKVIQEQCRENVRNTIEKYSYSGDADLDGIADVADKIMVDVLSDPEVMYQVSGIRDKSDSTYLHSINVTALSVLIGFKLKLSEKRVREMAVGALLHDIGTVFMPSENKCEAYNEDNNKNHVVVGYSVVENEKWISKTAKDIILMHHERCDGSGYPMGMKGNGLKLENKIVSVCDEFDNMVYGSDLKKKKVYEVIEYITSQAGTKFDFKVVEAFVSSVAVYPVGSYVLTNEGEIGIVVRQNNKMPSRPVIRMLFDNKRERYTANVEKDLTKELTLFIKDTIEK